MMFNRRHLVTTGLALAVTPSLAGLAKGQTAKPMLVFVGNETCGACKFWRARAEPEFLKSDAFRKLDYRVVYPKNEELIVKEASWPADARWILPAFLATKEGKDHATDQSLFILAQDGKIAFIAVGMGGWQDKMKPKIAEATGSKA